jgi:hypothetical protein
MRAAPLVVFLLNKQLQITTETPSNYDAHFSKTRHVAHTVYSILLFFFPVYGYEENVLSDTHSDILSPSIITTESKSQTKPILEQYMQNSMTLPNKTGI